MVQVLVAALYKFVALPDYERLRQPLLQCCQEHGVKGTLLLASEGINGTVAGSPEGIHQVLNFLRRDERLADLHHNESQADSMPFYRMKVRLKKEIVTMGVEGIDPGKSAGTYVSPEHWNDLIADPDVVIIDTRNDYEVGIGTFEGAINPHTRSFRELPEWLHDRLAGSKKTPVAMFCTGGIRCEKSTAFLKSVGFETVYHLQGGILNYLETVDASESLWKGECFVFDQRVSVRHGLEPGSYDRCHACRMPIHEQDKQCAAYEEGVSCSYCHSERSDEDRRRFRERQKQIELATQRGTPHLGIRRLEES